MVARRLLCEKLYPRTCATSSRSHDALGEGQRCIVLGLRTLFIAIHLLLKGAISRSDLTSDSTHIITTSHIASSYDLHSEVGPLFVVIADVFTNV